MSRLLVTGASGLLGFHFAWLASEQAEVIGITHTQELLNTPFISIKLDLSQPGTGRQILQKYHPDVLIHCAALANVDLCARQPELARQINTELSAELAIAAQELGTKMVHISTDAVFDGVEGDYHESDKPNPLSVYAHTKWEAEQAVMETCPSAIIARVNFYGWSLSGKHSLAEWFFNNLSSKKPMNGFMDIFYCPLEVTQLCNLLTEMVEKDLKGLYHVVSQEKISKYAFGVKLAEQFALDSNLIQPVSWKEGNLLAARSPLLTLQTHKLRRDLGKPLPGIQEGMERFYRAYQDKWHHKMRSFVKSSAFLQKS